MHKIQKFNLMPVLSLLILLLGSSASLIKQDFKPDSDQLKSISSIRQIGNSLLREMDYTGDYKFDEYLTTGSGSLEDLLAFLKERLFAGDTELKIMKESFGCTCFSVSNEAGNKISCRNMDWHGDTSVLVLYTRPAKGYASISFSYPPALSPLAGGIKNIELLASPYSAVDGMNEYGMIAATLSVPNEAPPYDPDKITISSICVIRLVLDYTRTVDEAIELIKKYNISFKDMPGSCLHYFLSDRSGNSAVVEFIDHNMKIIRNTKPWQAVTNFRLSKVGDIEDWRYQTVVGTLEPLNGVISAEKAMALLKSVSQKQRSHTMWSAVYNQSTGEVRVAIDRNYGDILTFNLEMKP